MTRSNPSVTEDTLKLEGKRQRMQKSTVKRLCLSCMLLILLFQRNLYLFSKGACNLKQKVQ